MLRKFSLTACVVASLVLLLSQPGEAAKVKVWHHHQHSHHEKAQFKQAVVTSEGALRLSRQLRPLANLESAHVWEVVEDRQGNLFAATGDEGKLYKITPDGKASVVHTSRDSQILSLAITPDGTVFAGTGPSGTIIAIPPEGQPRLFAEDLDSYVWCLAHNSTTKSLYAGTGPKGRIYEIGHDGKSRVFYATKQEHILSLAIGPDQKLYAGTDKNGLVYRIEPMGKAFVLFQAPQAEIRSLLVTSDAVYAGTSSPIRRRGSTGVTNSSSSGNSSISTLAGNSSQAVAKLVVKTGITPASAVPSASSSSSEESRSGGGHASTPPAGGENSLYRIAHDGTVRELFRDKALILCSLRENNRILVGTGTRGQLFEIDETSKERTEIARLDHGLIHCMVKRRDGSIVVGAGDPGKLYVLESRFAGRGTVLSEVLDAKITSRWGALTWKANLPAGTSLSLAFRTGNVSEPDETWSDWSAEITQPNDSAVPAPAARFLQYRVTLTTNNPRLTPELRTLSLRYLTTNQGPEITAFEVPDLDAANLDNPKKLKLKWSASDSNDDELTYNLYVRKDGWADWVLLEEEFEKKDYEWDTSTFPSGMYQLKLVASDRRDNSPQEALTVTRLSAPFPVSHIPPAVTVKVNGMDGGQVLIEADAKDPLVRLTEASFSVNGKRWINVFPADGLFDSKAETFRFRTDSLRPGTYVLVLRVRDAAGNIGSGDVVFVVREKGAR